MKSDRLTRKTTLKKISSLKPDGEITLYDFTTTEITDSPFFPLSGLYEPGSESLLEDEAPYNFHSETDILRWCAALIFESPTAGVMYGEAEQGGWNVGFGTLNGGGFHLDMKKKRIVLDHFSMTPSALGRSAYFRNIVLVTMIRALRDIWHERRHAPFETEYSPEDVLMLERLRAADCDTVTILSAWELRGAGFGEIWRHVIGSAEGDMAMIFTRVLERDPAAFLDGAALAYALRQWYADETRVNGCDHETLEALDDLMIGSEQHNPFGSTRLSEEKIESIGLLPDGTCYLAGLGETIKNDPFFAGLKDEINQCHLFQLMYDMEVTVMGNVPFRDRKLAAMMFPTDTDGSVN